MVLLGPLLARAALLALAALVAQAAAPQPLQPASEPDTLEFARSRAAARPATASAGACANGTCADDSSLLSRFYDPRSPEAPRPVPSDAGTLERYLAALRRAGARPTERGPLRIVWRLWAGGCSGFFLEAVNYLAPLWAAPSPDLDVALLGPPRADWCQGLPDADVRALDALQAKLSRPRSPGFWALDASIDVFIDHAPPDRFAQFPLAIPLEEDAPVALVPRSGARERDLLRPRYLIGRSMVESTALPPAWPSALAPLNEVWLPARFLVPVFAAAGGASERLFVLREAIDTEVFDPQRVQPLPWLVREARGRFVFLSSFRWQLRKGWDLLFRAYLEEFRGERDTLLVVLAARDAGAEAELQGSLAELLAHPDAPAHLLITDVLSTQEMPRLYRSADAFVLPTRGEGWGLPVAEAMAMALPTIATSWSGVTEFMDESNSFPVPIEGLVPTPAGSLHFGSWAAPSLPALRRHMRRVFADRVEARRRGARARATMVARFSRPAISDALRARLSQLRTALRD